ncbi:MAG TPA: glycogen debranching N-terminal domain-containing protein [Acidimicrobiales bacterium]|nr:glycogen debranching N-terminal domain-containing protein [Acidimicrobiales bacterium]
MADPWSFEGESVSLGRAGASNVTLVEGSAFAISDSSGNMAPGAPHGLFFRDTRFLSRLELRVNGQYPEVLAATSTEPFSAQFALRARSQSDARGESGLMIFRNRYVGRGMREDLIVRNFGEEPAYCQLHLELDSDFADLFEVKEGRQGSDGEHRELAVGDGELSFAFRKGGVSRGARIRLSGEPELNASSAVFEVIVPAHGQWATCIQVTPVIEGEEIEPRYLCGQPVERATPGERLARWRSEVPLVESDHPWLGSVVARGAEDLGALRIFDPEFPDRTVVAAGAPWFMTLFGRDSLITSWMALIVDPDLALGVLQTLARFQGTEVDPRNEEEPGRILHEMRFGEAASLSLGGGRIYYGTADATPLFVMLLGELRRWGLARDAVDELIPHADFALRWISEFGDRDGDGYVEYQRASDRGLANQGWKDSWDGVRFSDGALPRTPIALAEVQAYVYGAYIARAHFADEMDEPDVAKDYRARAQDLRSAFNRDFWLEERGWFAMGLDADKRPIDALASNMGHCLWTGIVDEEKAPLIADRLLSPQMFNGWGIRTLGSTMGGYNPISYHCGSVWPHDSAIIAAGLMRYGLVDHAQRVIMALLDAASSQGGRLPELYAGLDRTEYPGVVSYPTSCSPQAWSSAAPLLLLRTLLRFEPWAPHGKLWLDPVLPEEISYLCVQGIPLAGSRLTVRIDGGDVEVRGVPSDLEVIREPRRPLSDM